MDIASLMPTNRISIPLDCFESRYTLRHPVMDDLPALLRLDKACQPPGLRNTEDELCTWIAEGSYRHVILEIDDHIVGAVYTQRIDDVTEIRRHTFRSVGALSTEDGPVVQLLSVNVVPSLISLGYGDQLLAFVLRFSALKPGAATVAAVVRCRKTGSFQEYIHRRTPEGALLDPELDFHHRHGAVIDGLIANYRPADTQNGGHGVLMVYDLARLVDTTAVAAPVSARTVDSAEALADTVHSAVRFVLTSRNRQAVYDARSAFNDMGMDTLDRFGLRMILARRLKTEIAPTLFYRYSSPAAVIDYFTRRFFPETAADRVTRVRSARRPAWCTGLPGNAVAVVGMACRFPGADDLEEYWDLLAAGREAITETPPERWDMAPFFGRRSEAGKICTSRGGYLSDVAGFDARFFGISPREARQVDPQQRLLLELNRDALEHAGIAPHTLGAQRPGFYVGIFSNDYHSLQLRRNRWTDYDMYFATGTSPSTAAGRLAYTLGGDGPALTLNTACSSGLVAVHTACQSLRYGECDVALASGVNLILSPEISLSFSRAGMLSPDGSCRAFDASANGYVRSEGGGVVVLKRLDEALAHNHTIYGILRGSVINQDGASNGLTAPNGLAQVSLIRQALHQAGLAPEDIDFLEAHGTGTVLGDPIEYEALLEVFGERRSRERPLVIGSVKTNIGHTESAAGLAGLIKVLLCLKHRHIPPHLHFRKPNRLIDLDALPAVIPADGCAWPASDNGRHRCAGVSSFGFSGTNAHVIVQEAGDPTAIPDRPGAGVLTLSATTPAALTELVGRFAEFLSQRSDLDAADVCYTSQVGRTHFDCRLSIVGKDTADISRKLSRVRDTRSEPGVPAGGLAGAKLAFLFTGQGSQTPGAGKGLYAAEPAFRMVLDECDAILAGRLEASLRSLLFTGGTASLPLNRTVNTQPALFALEYALARLWLSRGIVPDIMMGHSVGEYVAACLAGVFSLEDALTLIAARGRLMQDLPAGGGMAAVLWDAGSVEAELARFDGRLEIAAFNGPANVVVSGVQSDLSRFMDILNARNVRAVPLKVSRAFHSFLMAPMLDEFRAVARTVDYAPPQMKMVANLTGELADTAMASSDYWIAHARQPVRFSQGVASLLDHGTGIFLEVGPRPVLINMVRYCLPTGYSPPPVLVSSLVQAQADNDAMDQALAALYAAGVAIDWTAVNRRRRCRRIALPTYPYQRRSYWIGGADAVTCQPAAMHSGHPLLGTIIDTPLPQTIYAAGPGVRATGYLADHRLGGTAIMPAAGYLEIGLAAGQRMWSKGRVCLREMLIQAPLMLPDGQDCRLQTVVAPVDSDAHRLTVHSWQGAASDGRWQAHCTMTLEPGTTETMPCRVDTGAFKRVLKTSDGPATPAAANPATLEFGPSFGGLARFAHDGDRAVGQVCLPMPFQDDDGVGDYRFHPALLDACLQAASTALVHDHPQAGGRGLILMAIDAFDWYAAPATTLWCLVEHLNSACDASMHTADLMIYNPDGAPVARARGLGFRFIELARPVIQDASTANAYRVVWHAAEPAVVTGLPRPRAIAAALETPSPGPANHIRNVQRLDAASRHHVRRALVHLGWRLEPGQRFTMREIVDRLAVDPRHHRLMARFMAMLEAGGDLMRRNGTWQVNAAILASDDTAVTTHDDGHLDLEMALLDRCGSRLAAVLRGTCDPLELLFPKGDLTGAARLYEVAPAFAPVNRIIGRIVSLVVEGTRRFPSDDAPLRILEIGAGTGGTTRHILSVLNGQPVRYTFTDVTPLFIRKAKESFLDCPFMSHRLLDIEKDPVAQGFVAGGANLVIAANVLHATADLGVSLTHARRLLAPGGLLLLVEGAAPRDWIDLIFGLTDGWWKFTDHRRRPDYPLMPARAWKQLLTEKGFDEVESFTPIPESAALFPQSVMVARVNDARMPTRVAGETGRHWLLVGGQRGAAEGLALALADIGDTAVRVADVDETDGSADGAYLAADTPEAFRSLLAEHPQTTHIAYLRGTDSCLGASMDGAALESCLGHSCGGLLHLVQALAAALPPGIKGLWIVTSGGQAVTGGDIPDPVQAPLWGLVDGIRAEHPELNCRIVDIDAPMAAEDWTHLAKLFGDSGARQATVLRCGHRLHPRLVPVDLPPARATSAPAGSVLITGGLGELGLLVARHLSENGYRHLTLMGRRPSSPAARQAIDALTARGVAVDVMAGDVGDEAQLTRRLDRIARQGPPLKGIVHLAGTFHDNLLANQRWCDWRRVFTAKVLGSWHLHRLTCRCQLDFFILFSSAMTMLPGPGLGSYLAANRFMDQLAGYRRRMGLPALSIAWGPWCQAGMAGRVAGQRRAQWAACGLSPLRAVDALTALDRLMGANDETTGAHVGVMAMDWDSFAQSGPMAEAPFYAGLVRRPAADARPGPGGSPSLREMLCATTVQGRPQALDTWLRNLVAEIMGFDRSEQLDAEVGFFQQGMDSLTAVELRGRLQEAAGRPLPATLVFKHPTIQSLGRCLADSVFNDLLDSETDHAPGGSECTTNATEAEAYGSCRNRVSGGIDAELCELERLLVDGGFDLAADAQV